MFEGIIIGLSIGLTLMGYICVVKLPEDMEKEEMVDIKNYIIKI